MMFSFDWLFINLTPSQRSMFRIGNIAYFRVFAEFRRFDLSQNTLTLSYAISISICRWNNRHFQIIKLEMFTDDSN